MHFLDIGRSNPLMLGKKALAFGILSASLAVTLPLQSLAIEAHSYKHYQDAALLERQGKYAEAEQELRFAIAKDPYDCLNYIKLSNVLAQQGKPKEAISLLQKAASMESQDGMIYFTLGGLYEEQGDYAAAEEAYRRALGKNALYKHGFFNLARVQTQLGKYPEAIESYRAFLQKYDDNFEARSHLARLLLVTGDDMASAGEFERIKLEYPKRFKDHVYYAKALNKINDPSRALDELKEALKQEGDKADIAEEMGNTHVALAQNPFAIIHYEKALRLDPSRDYLQPVIGDLYLKNEQPNEAIGYLQQYLTKHPEHLNTRKTLAYSFMKTQQYVPALTQLKQIESEEPVQSEKLKVGKDIAYAYQMSGDLDQAIAQYEKLLANPELSTDNQLKTNLAIAFHKKGTDSDLEQAAQWYELVYQSDPKANAAIGNDLANVYVTLGDHAYQTKQFDTALGKYQMATAFAKEDNIGPWLGMANTYYVTAKPTQAAECYKKVLERAPQNVLARLYQAKIEIDQHDASSKEVSSALAQIEALRDQHPENLDVRIVLAQSYQLAGQKDKAADAYFAAAQKQPELSHLWLQAGNLSDQTGKLNQAIQAYEKAAILAPDSAVVQYNLATVYQQKDQMNEAVRSYQAAYQLDPKLCDALYGMAVTYERQNRFQEAIEGYQKYLGVAEGQNYKAAAQDRLNRLMVKPESGVSSKTMPMTATPPQKSTFESSESGTRIPVTE
jgi:tetratricopeptide (TPR) repeat protein